MSKNRTRINVYLDDDILDMIRQDAKDNDQTQAEIIRGRLRHSFTNDIAYVNWVNAQFADAQNEDNEEVK